MKKFQLNLVFSLASVLAIGNLVLAAPASEALQSVDPAMVVHVEIDGWMGSLRLESDGEVEFGGQPFGEWFSIHDMDSDGGSILIDLGGGSTLDLEFATAPEVGEGGLALLNIGSSFLTGWYQFTDVATASPCEEERKEKVYCIDVGTEQLSGNTQRHIARVIYVTKCGVGWYEVGLNDGSRHSLDIIVTGNAGQSGKGTTSFDNKVSFVTFKRCP